MAAPRAPVQFALDSPQEEAGFSQAAGSDAVCASLIFLDLLKGQADGPPELFLAQAKHVPTQPHAGTDVDIDRARLAFGDPAVASVGALPSLVDCPRKGSGVK